MVAVAASRAGRRRWASFGAGVRHAVPVALLTLRLVGRSVTGHALLFATVSAIVRGSDTRYAQRLSGCAC